ncbi:hypothetical protein [Nonomuraea sp. NPDC049784]|uniref:hypothetical protein n=1 Tax=Nonomuraea sp. NPDC049784 TaxID=3154361 RepID=UPI00340C311B
MPYTATRDDQTVVFGASPQEAATAALAAGFVPEAGSITSVIRQPDGYAWHLTGKDLYALRRIMNATLMPEEPRREYPFMSHPMTTVPLPRWQEVDPARLPEHRWKRAFYERGVADSFYAVLGHGVMTFEKAICREIGWPWRRGQAAEGVESVWLDVRQAWRNSTFSPSDPLFEGLEEWIALIVAENSHGPYPQEILLHRMVDGD